MFEKIFMSTRNNTYTKKSGFMMMQNISRKSYIKVLIDVKAFVWKLINDDIIIIK